jgi:hypothetical protein
MEACGPGLIEVLSQNFPGGTEKTAKNLSHDVRIEVLTPVVMKSSVFWDITPCSLLKVK